jgi:hypothetical protein
MRELVSAPTPEDIEAALIAIRHGTSAYGRFARIEVNSPETLHEQNAEADRLYWVDVINPDGMVEDVCGGGTTPAEAAAVAWITTSVGAWWQHPTISDEDYAKVSRVVPEGWQFELCAGRCAPP